MKQVMLVAGSAMRLLVGFLLMVGLIVAAIDTPAVQQQMGVFDCTTPAADIQAAGQVQVLATDTSDKSGRAMNSTGTDVATTMTGRGRVPKGYQATRPDTAGGPRVMWRTDRWTRTAVGRAGRGLGWVTLRSASSTTMSVVSLGKTSPGAADLHRLISRLAGSVVVAGPTTRWPTTRTALETSRLATTARLLHKPRGRLFVATSRDSELRPVQHQVTDAGELLVGLSTPGQSAGTGAAADPGTVSAGSEEGGIGFKLPAAGQPRKASVTNKAQPIPANVKSLYRAAAARYKVPWTLLAGVGMEETAHGRNNATSSAGAQGFMQFMPSTFTRYGVDGDHDGRTSIRSDADSIFAAANYLTASGVTKGADGVRRALFAYNHADWYVNDVLTYAAAYGGGTVLGDPTDCGSGNGNTALPALTTDRARKVLAWGQAQLGEPYVFGSNGPNSWDCSSFTRTAYAQIGITLPRTAAAQRDWLAAGNGYRVPASRARPADLVFADTYRGPNAIGHVMLVLNPATGTSLEAGGSKVQNLKYTRYAHHHIFEIWRVGNVADHPTKTAA